MSDVSRSFQFHLQGQHDQQKHAGGRTAAVPGDSNNDGVPDASTRKTDVDHRSLAANAIGGKPVKLSAADADDVVAQFATHDAPVDLTLLTVEGMPGMFAEMRGNGVPRAEMPQIPTDQLGAFQNTLTEAGIGFAPGKIDPAQLKATQSELDGRKVGGMLGAMREGKMNLQGDPIWVSSDGHILDGHHRWAAAASISADCGGCIDIPIITVDVPMSQLLSFANTFNDQVGVQRKKFGEQAAARMFRFASEKKVYPMATDAADGVDDADLADLPHGDGSAFKVKKTDDEKMTARRFQFHLQGQHDQQNHAGGRGKGKSGTIFDDIEGYDPAVAQERAATMRQLAERVEPEITESLSRMIGDSAPGEYREPAPGEGDLYGYEFRLKSEAKIAEKIGRVMVEKGLTLDEAAADIKDAVRYTAHFDEAEFGDRTQSVIDQLRAENPEVVVKNTWPPEKNVPYKGVNVNVTRDDGLVYEIQFHTPESQAVKDQMHLLYEEQRVLPKGSSRWQSLEDQMLTMGTQQPVPRDADKVFRLERRTSWYNDAVRTTT